MLRIGFCDDDLSVHSTRFRSFWTATVWSGMRIFPPRPSKVL